MVGMLSAHAGVAVFILGVTLVRSGEVERDVKMDVGDTTEIGDYVFTFRGVREVPGPNYRAAEGTIDVTENGRPIVTLHPQKRIYTATQSTLTEAAIDPGLRRDLYLSLGEPVLDGTQAGAKPTGAWVVRVYYKPFVDWIWGGCLIMAIGGLLAATDRRYRARIKATKVAAAAKPPAVGRSPEPATAT